jgi:hypothetical protein
MRAPDFSARQQPAFPQGLFFDLNTAIENHVMRISQVSSTAFEFVQRVMPKP